MAASTDTVPRDVFWKEDPMLPIYKQLSLKNGQINKMTKQQLKKKLMDLHLDGRGVKEVLKKRLKNFYRKREMTRAKIQDPGNHTESFNYLAVIDFEATCQENNTADYKHEIIEFPIVLVDTEKKVVVDEFHSYVKPIKNPKLTDFCTTLTGISQETVSRSDTFPVVLKRVEEWISSRNLGEEGQTFAVLTDGPWDMGRFMHIQCMLSQVPFPQWAIKWVNIKKSFSNYYGCARLKLTSMLGSLGMEFEGNQHSGIDDARNIARIAIRMLEDGCDIQPNERIFREKLKKHNLDAGDIKSIKKKTRSAHAAQPAVSSSSGEDDYADCTEQLSETDFHSENKTKNQMHKTAELMASMTINNHCENSDSEENFEDLLSYYALQKSRSKFEIF